MALFRASQELCKEPENDGHDGDGNDAKLKKSIGDDLDILMGVEKVAESHIKQSAAAVKDTSTAHSRLWVAVHNVMWQEFQTDWTDNAEGVDLILTKSSY